MDRRTLRVAMVAVLATIVITPIILVALPGPISLGPVASVSPTVSASPEADASTQPDAAGDTAWWRIEPDAAGSLQVHIGSLGGGETVVAEIRTRPVAVDEMAVARPHPRVIGPSGGVVVLIEEDGAESVLTAVTAATGEARELLRSRELILDAALAGDEIIFLTAREADGTPLGLWRLDLADGAEPEPIPGVLAAASDVMTVAIVEWITELVTSPDGTVVAVHRCVRLDCELRGADLTTRESWRIPLEWGSGPVAILGGFVVLEPACVDVDCRVELLDLVSGARREAPGSLQRNLFDVETVAEPRPMIVTSLAGVPVAAPGAGPVGIELLDLESMTFAPLELDLGSVALAARFGGNAGIELAPGTILVVGSPRAAGAAVPAMGYHVVDVETGEVVAIPELGQVFVQG